MDDIYAIAGHLGLALGLLVASAVLMIVSRLALPMVDAVERHIPVHENLPERLKHVMLVVCVGGGIALTTSWYLETQGTLSLIMLLGYAGIGGLAGAVAQVGVGALISQPPLTVIRLLLVALVISCVGGSLYFLYQALTRPISL